MSWFDDDDEPRKRSRGKRRNKLLEIGNLIKTKKKGRSSREEKSETVIPATANAVLNESKDQEEGKKSTLSCFGGCHGCGGCGCGGDCGGGCGPCH